MKTLNKKRIIVGLIVLLLLINLSAIVTIGYNKYEKKKNTDKEYISRFSEDGSPHKRMKLFVKKELELSESQFELYSSMKDENLTRTKKHIKKIRAYKKSIIDEINKDHPDSLALKILSDSIGEQHTFIQLEMNRHFLAVKQILEPYQQEKLKKLLMRMDERYRTKKRKFKNKEKSETKNKLRNKQTN